MHFSITPKNLWRNLGTSHAPIIVDVRKPEAVAASNGLLPAIGAQGFMPYDTCIRRVGHIAADIAGESQHAPSAVALGAIQAVSCTMGL